MESPLGAEQSLDCRLAAAVFSGLLLFGLVT